MMLSTMSLGLGRAILIRVLLLSIDCMQANERMSVFDQHSIFLKILYSKLRNSFTKF
jgi:hypothetical protein